MEKRKLGNSDLEVSAIAFGAWAIGGWMWGGADSKEGDLTGETGPADTMMRASSRTDRPIFFQRHPLHLHFALGGLFWSAAAGYGGLFFLGEHSGYLRLASWCSDLPFLRALQTTLRLPASWAPPILPRLRDIV